MYFTYTIAILIITMIGMMVMVMIMVIRRNSAVGVVYNWRPVVRTVVVV
jgi:hypothetical protein